MPWETPGSCEPELETELAGWPPRTADGHIDMDVILALLPDGDPGENPWGTAFESLSHLTKTLNQVAWAATHMEDGAEAAKRL